LLEWSADPFEPRWCPWIVAVTVDPGGVPKHAILTAGSGGGGRCQSWPHGLLAGERADEDQPSLLTVRTDPRFDRRHWPHAGWYEWRGGRVLHQLGNGWHLELQHLPHPGGVVALRGMPQAEVADLVKTARQHVLEEAAHELIAVEAAGSRPGGLAFLVLEGDRIVVEADDTCIGESDAKDVAGEVVEHRLFTVSPGGDVEDPRLAPYRVGDDEIRTLPLQQRPEFAPYQLGKSFDGNQEVSPRRVPGAGGFGDPAAA